MKLEQLIERCADALQEEVNNDLGYQDMDSVSCHLSTNNGQIDLFYYLDKKTRNWLCEVTVTHDNNEHFSSNLEEYLSEELADCIDWDVAREEWAEANMDEYQRNGFASASDFWNWKEGI